MILLVVLISHPNYNSVMVLYSYSSMGSIPYCIAITLSSNMALFTTIVLMIWISMTITCVLC